MRSSRFYSVTVLAVVLSALVGGFFGSSVLATQDEVQQQYRIFTAALAAVERDYVEDVPSPTAWSTARSTGCCRRSIRIRASSIRSNTRRCASGRKASYYGLGIQIQVIDGDITVMSIFEGSPAYKKGLRRGDVIARIERRRREGLDERAGGQQAARARKARPSTSRSGGAATTI